MAAKTQANWSQGNRNENNELRIVHTCTNTSISDWKELVRKELEGSEVDFESIVPLKLLHAWEMGDTPYAFAYMLKDQLKRIRNSAMIRANNR